MVSLALHVTVLVCYSPCPLSPPRLVPTFAAHLCPPATLASVTGRWSTLQQLGTCYWYPDHFFTALPSRYVLIYLFIMCLFYSLFNTKHLNRYFKGAK